MTYAFSPLGSAETKYFFELTPERILEAVESLGLVCTGRCLALNSMENRVYEVEIDIGDTPTKRPSDRFRIIKFYRPGRWTREQIADEHRFLLDLVEYEIPVVAPSANANGETLFRLKDVDILFAVFPKQGGRNPEELNEEQVGRVGRLLGRMHSVGRTKQASSRLRLTPENIGLQSLEFLLDSGSIPREVEDSYEGLVRSICDLSSPWFEGINYQRIHGDCHLGNLLWSDEGPFWVDFDDMMQGPPVQDLWLMLPGRDDHAKRLLHHLLEGYEQMGDFDRSTLRLIEPLRALRMIYFTAWIAKRWEDPAFKRAFVDFGTPRYWREQIDQLNEQLELMNSAY